MPTTKIFSTLILKNINFDISINFQQKQYRGLFNTVTHLWSKFFAEINFGKKVSIIDI